MVNSGRIASIGMGAVLAGFVMLGPVSCDRGPIEWTTFDERTIDANLTAVDSASAMYWAHLQTEGVDAAVAAAQAFLDGHPGVSRTVVTEDSLVWAVFENGILVGLGDLQRPIDTVAGQSTGREPDVLASAGGEAGDMSQYYVNPHLYELPGTVRAARAIQSNLERRLWFSNGSRSTADEPGQAREAISLPGVLFWSGHGMLTITSDTSNAQSPALVLGWNYPTKEKATEWVQKNPDDCVSKRGEPWRVVILKGARFWTLGITPAFIRAYGKLGQPPMWPYFNDSRSIVHISCCYGAYSPDGTSRPLLQAFRDAGAALVSGYDWAVGDAWSCGKDSSYFQALADTCLPMEAVRSLGGITEPRVGRGGKSATFRVVGDTLATLRPVVQQKVGEEVFRAASVLATSASQWTVTAVLKSTQDQSRTGQMLVGFPGAPGTYNVTTTGGATVVWNDNTSGHAFFADSGCVGVSFTVRIDQLANDHIIGHFSGTLGYWSSGDPSEDPPDETVTITDGVMKYTGRIEPVLLPKRERGGLVGSVTAHD